MLNAIPVVGWILDFLCRASLAFPFWLIWTVWGVGQKYFYFLPEVYLTPGFWNCVGVFIVVGILKTVFVPKLASINNEQKIGTSD